VVVCPSSATDLSFSLPRDLTTRFFLHHPPHTYLRYGVGLTCFSPCEATIHTSKESNNTDNSPSECPFPNDRLGHAIANMIHTGTYTWCDAYWKSDTFTFSETIPLCPKGPCGEQYQRKLPPYLTPLSNTPVVARDESQLTPPTHQTFSHPEPAKTACARAT
jgi:hypothetical protein